MPNESLVVNAAGAQRLNAFPKDPVSDLQTDEQLIKRKQKENHMKPREESRKKNKFKKTNAEKRATSRR